MTQKHMTLEEMALQLTYCQTRINILSSVLNDIGTLIFNQCDNKADKYIMQKIKAGWVQAENELQELADKEMDELGTTIQNKIRKMREEDK